mmetsp:Transcript_20153/g.27225  ORF Transcript_20153/g.27225 Transcript_20153/m.27225 type:complete len:98 (+) Transcript_20153:3151-3444(+)
MDGIVSGRLLIQVARDENLIGIAGCGQCERAGVFHANEAQYYFLVDSQIEEISQLRIKRTQYMLADFITYAQQVPETATESNDHRRQLVIDLHKAIE